MAGRFMRSAFRGVALLASTSSSAAAWAQVQPVEAAQPRETIDENGVDLSTGKYTFAPVGMSIGGERGLSWSAGRDDLVRTRMVPTSYTQTGIAELSVSIGNDATLFTNVNGAWVAKERNGYTLVYNSTSKLYVYTTSSGDVANFFAAGSQRYAGPDGELMYPASSIVMANKDTIRFGYSPTQWKTCAPNIPDYQCNSYAIWYRPVSITKDSGYSLSVKYKQDYISTGYRYPYPPMDWRTPSRYTLGRTSACVASANEVCTTPGAYPYVDIAGSQYTDAAGRVTTVSSSGIRLPGSSTDDVAVSYANSRVSSVVAAGVTTSYNFSDSGDVRTVTVARGSLPARVTTFRISTLQVLSEQWKTDPAGPTYTRSYSYDPASALLTRITEPEGNYTAFSYDARGNVTETRMVSKTPGTPPDLVTRATYDAACANAVICNKPITTTDVRGGVTNYAYDPVHGGVTSVKAPAPDPNQPNLRPETRYSYSQLGSNGAASSTGTWTLTGVSACATTVSCIGTADESRTTIAYGYGLNVTSVTQAAGDNSVSSSTSTTYDALGNAVAVDGPLPGSDDTTRTRYDVLRRPIGTTAPDPDGSGARLAMATRTTYNVDGTVQSVEQGTDSTPSAADFNGFVSMQQVNTSYDGYHRKVKDTLTAGGQTYAVSQQSYDGLSRLDCTVTRMDPGQWSNQPDACAPQTGSGNGPDRVSKRIYDTGGRAVGVTTAFGTPEASTESTSYTIGGQTATVTDANGNVTAMAYDAFDRPWRTCFQTGSSAACAGSPGDFQQTNYAANGDVSSLRLRDGQVLNYQYDGLGRRSYDDNPNSNVAEVDVSYSYDLLGRMTRAQDQNGWFNVASYDALGRLTGQSSNVSSNSLQYDAGGRLARQTWADGFYVTYEYDATGAMTAVRENGGFLLGSYGYDNLGRRTTLARGNGTVTSYGYDPVSRLSSLTQDLAGGAQDQSLTFSYNPAGQIVGRTASNDAYAFNGHYNIDRGYAANGLNQYTGSGGMALSYDGRGNLVNAGGTPYQYNTRNQLFMNAAGQLIYRNPAGNIGQTPGTNYDYVGDVLVTEAGNGIQRRYVWGAGTDEPLVWYEGAGTGDRRWLHADERGSVIAVTNGSGAALAINSYDEFGIPSAGNQGRFQYTGQKWVPELGMYDYKARMYSPTLGRFMQTDPIGYGDGINWYNYGGSDPVNNTDPSGLALYPGTWRCPRGYDWGHPGSCRRPGSTSSSGGWTTVTGNGTPFPATLDCLGKGQPGGGYGMCDDGRTLAPSIPSGFSPTLGGPTNFGIPSTPIPPNEQTRKISPCTLRFLASKGLGGPNLGSVTFHNGDGGSLIAKAAFAHGNPAITIKNNVYVAPGQWKNFREGTAGFFEETVHSMQWAESGTEGFIFAWLVGTAAGGAFTGDGHNSPLEAQAMGMSVNLQKAYSGQCRR